MTKYSAKRSGHKHLIEASPWLRSIDRDVAGLLCDRAKSLSFARGRLLFNMEDDPVGIYGIVTGTIGLRTEDSETATLTGHLLGQGEWFGAAAMLLNAQRLIGAVALTDCQLLFVSEKQIDELSQDTQEIWRALAILVARQAHTATRIAHDLMIRDPLTRCCATLERLSGGSGFPTELPITQTELADMCNLSRGAVSAILRKLQEQGFIRIGYGKISVLKPRAHNPA